MLIAIAIISFVIYVIYVFAVIFGSNINIYVYICKYCLHTQAVCAKRPNVERWHIKCLSLLTVLLFAHSKTTDVK